MEIKLKGRNDNYLVLEIMEEGKEKPDERPFIGVRCGLSWPLPVNAGGYFLLLAQEAKKLITGESPLWVIREYQAQTLEALFEKMFNEMGIFGCFEIFTILSGRYESFMKALDSYRRNNRALQNVKIKPAPYGDMTRDSFIHGNDMIMKWLKVIKGLTIPKDFCIRSQLREIRESDLDGSPHEKFFAMNALRYALGAFETSKIPESTSNRVPERGIPPGAWT